VAFRGGLAKGKDCAVAHRNIKILILSAGPPKNLRKKYRAW